MRSSFAKSIYVGAAVLGLAGLSAVTTTTASAKSYATAGAYTALADKSQNVTVTGTNAIYSKPGTVKGAKVVASKKTVAKLAASKKSSDTFYAYGTKTTNRGSVYYKIVTMNKKYRGYIYGGKTAGTFAGGIKTTETMTKATMPKETTVYFANPGTTNVTWTAPKNTDINAKKNVVNTTPFAGDKLTITDAATKTKEGSLYYYVKDATHPSVSGWIYSGAVTSDSSVAYNQATDVKVNFVSPEGTAVASSTLQKLTENNAANTGISNPAVAANAKGTQVGFDAKNKATNAWGKAALTGTGYVYSSETASNLSALLGAKTGDTITLTVTKGTQVVQGISAYYQKGTKVTPLVAKGTKDANGVALNYQVTFPTLGAAFAGSEGATYTATDVQSFLTTNKADTLNSADYAKDDKGNLVDPSDSKAVKDSDGKVVVYHTTYTLTSGVAGTYTASGKASAFYNTAKEVKGSATTTNTGAVSVFG
ncbi:hypothetical protein CNR30_01105 [Levilactobacillus brevis]|uniref:hypothetical protein n=1 Tax=Levilactobacillus brevis TaxID=1580 RepID=UPI0005AA49F9|nr:hypothetical protein [Levilactobacillus brevis]RDF15302.1 hypothetical protein CNR30_01105 [Levilactobacillus brevis]